MKELEAQVQKLSPSPGDVVIITLPPDTPDKVGEKMAQRLDQGARVKGFSTIITTIPLKAECLSAEEGLKLLKALGDALTERPEPDGFGTNLEEE